MRVSSLFRLVGGIPEFFWQGLVSLIRSNDSELAAVLRRNLYGNGCDIDTGVVIKNRNGFRVGTNCVLYHGTYILNPQGIVALGNHSHLGAYCFVNACFGTVSIGDHVAIGPGTKIFSYSNHYEMDCNVTDVRITKDVFIGNNVFIGANCSILPGTRIEDNVILAAGSVAKGTLDADSIYGGTPCTKIRSGWYSPVPQRHL
jgi:acetyltransferase-like isoleucine patch superfamily enzyme